METAPANFISFYTHFGDTTLLAPASLAVILALVALGHTRAALALVAGLSVAAVSVALAKLTLSACPQPRALLSLGSPSGHAAMSAAFYGSLALLVRLGAPAGAGLAGALGLLGLTRVWIGAHSFIEVITGLALGGAGLITVWRLRPDGAAPKWLMASAIAAIAAAAPFMESVQIAPEGLIQSIARIIGMALGCRA